MAKISLPESSPSPWPVTRLALKGAVVVLVFLFVWRYTRGYFLHHAVSPAVASGLILLTGALGALTCYYFWLWLQALDEHQRELQYRAIAWVVPLFLFVQLACTQLAQAKMITFVVWHVERVGLVMGVIYLLTQLWLYLRNR